MAQGRYQNASEVVRAGLRLLEDYEVDLHERAQLLKAKINEAWDQIRARAGRPMKCSRASRLRTPTATAPKKIVVSLLLRPAAEADLDDIYRYIAEQSGSPETAISYVRRVREWCEHLRIFPLAGRSRDDLRPGVRITTFERRIVIAYTVLPSGDVEIGRFFYGGRNYEAILNEQS